MRLFSKIRENLQKNRGTLAQKLMGGMGMMEKMPEGMRPRRREGIVQGMFPRLDKQRMGRMPEPEMRTMPIAPPAPFVPRPPSKGMPIDPGRMPRFQGGGSVYPNKGLAALAEVAPEVVKRMGYEGGGAVTGSSPYKETLQKMGDYLFKEMQNPGRTLSRQDRIIASGMAEPLNEIQNFPRRDAQMMIDELMDSIQNGSPEQMAEKSFLLDRLQELDLSPEQQNQVFVISRMLKERNIPVGGMKVTETSVEMMPGERGRTISDRDRDIISQMMLGERGRTIFDRDKDNISEMLANIS